MLTLEHHQPLSVHIGAMHLIPHPWEPSAQSMQPGHVEEDAEEAMIGECPPGVSPSYFDDEEDEDEEAAESCNCDWKAQFEEILAEDEQRQQAIKEKRKEKGVDDAPQSKSPSQCRSYTNRVHGSFGQEDHDHPPQPDPNRPPSPVSPALGRITFVHEGVTHHALQSPSGAIEHNGVRYESIRKWLREVFHKRL